MKNENTSVVSQTSGLAITSLVLGIISILGASVAIIPALLAIVFGHSSVSKCKKNQSLGGRGMGIAGLILGYLSLIPAIILISMFSIPKVAEVAESSKLEQINYNARQLWSGSTHAYLKTGQEVFTYEELIGPDKYVRELVPVDDETYPSKFVIDSPIVIKLKNGDTYSFDEETMMLIKTE